MVVFDEASRSPWGSLVFLWESLLSILIRSPGTRTSGMNSSHATGVLSRLTACLAAFLAVSVTAIGPFVQQILTQQFSPLPLGTASVPIFNWTSEATPGTNVTIGISDGDPVYDAANIGLHAHFRQSFDVQSTCVNANCSWAPFCTMAVEHECRNITEQLQVHIEPGVNSNETSWTLPNGFALLPGNDYPPNWYNLTNQFPTISFHEKGQVLSNFFIVLGRSDGLELATLLSIKSGTDSEYNGTALALECILQLAGRQIDARYENGVYTEKMIGRPLFNNTREATLTSPWRIRMASRALIPGGVDPWGDNHGRPEDDDGITFYNDPLWPSSIHNVTEDVGIFDLERGAALQYLFGAFLTVVDALTSILTAPQYFKNEALSDLDLSPSPYSAAIALSSLLSPGEWNAFLAFNDRLDNIAASLTYAFRTDAFSRLVLVNTTSYHDAILYKVTWTWIALPVALVLLTFVLLWLTALDTRRKRLQKWTDSSLSLIAFSADEDLLRTLRSCADLRAVQRLAKKRFVNMDNDNRLTSRRPQDMQSSLIP